MVDDYGNIVLVKMGCVFLLGWGLSEFFGGSLFGLILLIGISDDNIGVMFVVYFVIVFVVVVGCYYIYNVLLENWFLV